jgi:hypothetical protein
VNVDEERAAARLYSSQSTPPIDLRAHAKQAALMVHDATKNPEIAITTTS